MMKKTYVILLSEILQDEKFITESALNSIEALKIFKTFKPDLDYS